MNFLKISKNKASFLLIVVAGFILINGQDTFSKYFNGETKEDTSSKEDIKDIEINPTQEKSPTIFPTATAKPISPVITKSKVSSNGLIMEFVYPGAMIISSGANTLTLESFNDPKTITNWYKAKINEKDLGVTSFVTTNTNGNVLNKLSGANSKITIEIEISKKDSSNMTNITVSLL